MILQIYGELQFLTLKTDPVFCKKHQVILLEGIMHGDGHYFF